MKKRNKTRKKKRSAKAKIKTWRNCITQTKEN